MEEFLEHLRQDLNYSEITISEYKGIIKGYLVYIKFGTPTKESILEYANGRSRVKCRLDTFYKYYGDEFFKKTVKIDADIKNFLNTLDYIDYTKKRYTRILQKYKYAEDKIEFIKSYKIGSSRNLALKAINEYRKYKKQNKIKLTSL